MPGFPKPGYQPKRITQLLLYPLTKVVYVLYRIYLRTFRYQLVNFSDFVGIRSPENAAIFVLWNSKCLFLIPFGIQAPVKYLTYYDLKHWILQNMTGMSNEKRLVFSTPEKTVFQVARELKNKQHVCLAGDGPYGPPGFLKQGPVAIAARTGRAVVAMKVEVSRSLRLFWRWDKFEIGIPFSRVTITATSHTLQKGQDIENFRRKIEASLGKP